MLPVTLLRGIATQILVITRTCPCHNKDMAKVTSKLQITVPKHLAAELGLRPGDDIDWAVSGNSLRVTPAAERRGALDHESRLRLFDAATERQCRRQQGIEYAPAQGDRGWSREDLYDREGAR